MTIGWPRLILVAGLLLCLCDHASAQTVHGTAVDQRGVPVAGVVLLLIDDKSAVATRALSNERGEYRLLAPAAGTYRIRTLRIGFRPSFSEPITVAGVQSIAQRLVLSGLPFSLDTVKVAGRNACHTVGDSAAALFTVWEQVRTALAAAELSASSHAYTARTLAYERVLDRNSDRVREQKTTIGTSPVTKLWLTRPADSLRSGGYVIMSEDSTTYYAPGIEVLQSDTFLEDHCFRIVPSPDAARIGIEFTPSDDRRRVTEIRGVVWIDRASAELRSLEFKYANIPREQEARAGGEMAFVRLRNGAWAISRWNIHMPVLAQRRVMGSIVRYETFVLEVKVEGGELLIASGGNDTLYRRPPLVLNGIVVDSASGVPVAGAFVGLLGTHSAGVTDANGRFAIENVFIGEYTAEVHTSALDAIAVVSQSNISVIDSVTTIRLSVPSLGQLGMTLCGVTPNTRTGIVVGNVRFRGDSALAKNLRVFATWNSLATSTVGSNSTHQQHATTDAQGRFRICGVPIRTPLEIQAEIDSASAKPVTVQIVDGMFARADLLIDKLNSNEATFTGHVFADSTERPIADVDVMFPELHLSQRTDSAGAFHFSAIPGGTQTVAARRVGYGTLDAHIDFVAGRTIDRKIFLSRIASLDSVRVEAERVVLPEFEEHRKIGLGHFLVRSELAKQEGRKLSAVLAGLTGIRIIGGVHDAWVASGRSSGQHVPTSAETRRGAKVACYAQVYLDHSLVYGGRATDALFDVNSIAPASIEAIEYYAGASQTPLRYGGLESPCGVLVIWTRNTP
ncbi:MAG: hypothetical protein JWM95_2393 [Gemmatimonadetes bacterium]|nr:hypothetical protein [Gemmatimonadota bacterium]